MIETRRLAIVATSPDDSHAWNLVGVQLMLEQRGFRVVNLGPCTPTAELAEQIRDRRPALVVISTVNGHGLMSLPPMLDLLDLYQARGLSRIVVGGLLTTRRTLTSNETASLRAGGIDGIFTGADAWERFDAYLADASLGEAGRARAPNDASRPTRSGSVRGRPGSPPADAPDCARR